MCVHTLAITNMNKVNTGPIVQQMSGYFATEQWEHIQTNFMHHLLLKKFIKKMFLFYPAANLLFP